MCNSMRRVSLWWLCSALHLRLQGVVRLPLMHSLPWMHLQPAAAAMPLPARVAAAVLASAHCRSRQVRRCRGCTSSRVRSPRHCSSGSCCSCCTATASLPGCCEGIGSRQQLMLPSICSSRRLHSSRHKQLAQHRPQAQQQHAKARLEHQLGGPPLQPARPSRCHVCQRTRGLC